MGQIIGWCCIIGFFVLVYMYMSRVLARRSRPRGDRSPLPFSWFPVFWGWDTHSGSNSDTGYDSSTDFGVEAYGDGFDGADGGDGDGGGGGVF